MSSTFPAVSALLQPSLIGMAYSFLAGLIALHRLSRWPEHWRWHYFSYYCLVAAGMVLTVNHFLG